MRIISLTLGAILFTIIYSHLWPENMNLTQWDFAGGMFTGALAYYLLTRK
jgi:hypothetical protein